MNSHMGQIYSRQLTLNAGHLTDCRSEDDIRKVLDDHGLQSEGSNCTELLCRPRSDNAHSMVFRGLLELLELFVLQEDYVKNLLYISILEKRSDVTESISSHCNVQREMSSDIQRRLSHASSLTTNSKILSYILNNTVQPLFVGGILIELGSRLNLFVHFAQNARLVCTSVHELHAVGFARSSSDIIKCLLVMLFTAMSNFGFYCELLSQAINLEEYNGQAIAECVAQGTFSQRTTDDMNSQLCEYGFREHLYAAAIQLGNIDMIKVLQTVIYFKPARNNNAHLLHLLDWHGNVGPWHLFKSFDRVVHIFDCCRSGAEANKPIEQTTGRKPTLRILVKYYGKRFHLSDGK